MPELPPTSQRPFTPRLVEHHAGESWIGGKWDAGYEYDSYFVNYTMKAAPGAPPNGPRTIHHDDDGTWGYQRADGLLPGRTNIFQVQGCTETYFGLGEDKCWDWSPPYEAVVLAYPLHHGPDTCAPGFVRREARPDDHVSVTPAERTLVATQNATANERRAAPR